MASSDETANGDRGKKAGLPSSRDPSMSRHAIVVGAGVAGLTGAHLLSRCGWTVDLIGSVPAPERWITLSSQTQRLIHELWGRDVLAESAHYPLFGRRVSWSGADATELAEPLHAVELSSLAAAMRRNLAANACGVTLGQDEHAVAEEMGTAGESVVIEARGRSSSTTTANRLPAGSRHMRVWSSVALASPAGAKAEVLAGRGFWSFAFPIAADRISLQIAVPRPCPSLELRRIVHEASARDGSILRAVTTQMPDLFERHSSEFCIAPSLARGMFTSMRLAVGDALMTLDPLCGDGVGHGIKSALLAASVANSVGVTVSEKSAIAHFNARSAFAFKAHLRHCAVYYGSVGQPECWLDEMDAMKAAAAAAAVDDPEESLTLVVGGIDGSYPTVHGDLRVQLVAGADAG